jgi:transcriptional regulator with XRE-family HTH domain
MTAITATQNTGDILREIGARLRAFRLQQNRTVEQLAAQAGVGQRTIVRAESGASMTLETLVKLLRALGRVEALEGFLPPALVSPLQLAARQGRVRARAWAPRPSRKRGK